MGNKAETPPPVDRTDARSRVGDGMSSVAAYQRQTSYPRLASHRMRHPPTVDELLLRPFDEVLAQYPRLRQFAARLRPRWGHHADATTRELVSRLRLDGTLTPAVPPLTITGAREPTTATRNSARSAQPASTASRPHKTNSDVRSAAAGVTADRMTTPAPPPRREVNWTPLVGERAGTYPWIGTCQWCRFDRPGFGTLVKTAIVRRDEDTSSPEVTLLAQGTVVEVVQFGEGGRRARIIAPVEGWLSLWVEDRSGFYETLVAENAQLWLSPSDCMMLAARSKALRRVASAKPRLLSVPNRATLWRAWLALQQAQGVDGGGFAEHLTPGPAPAAHAHKLLSLWESNHCPLGTESEPHTFTDFVRMCVGDDGQRMDAGWMAEVIDARETLSRWEREFSSDLSTLENYPPEDEPSASPIGSCFGNDEVVATPCGGLRVSRAGLDTLYHGEFSAARSHWQDLLVGTFTPRTEPLERPVAIFTAGMPGAGKHYLCDYLSSRGVDVLSPSSIVNVDSEAIRKLLPEYDQYMAQHAEATHKAAEYTQREVNLISELTVSRAVDQGQNVWVHGTLRDADFHNGLFASIRSREPSYRIVVIWLQSEIRTCRQRINDAARPNTRGGQGQCAVSPVYFDECLNVLGHKDRTHARLQSLDCDYLLSVLNPQLGPPKLKHVARRIAAFDGPRKKPETCFSEVRPSTWGTLERILAGGDV
eukprot:TRINITY_DN1143_c0_g2_i6.p1 TRINITY_DN1143_c0_g2~~TRINITY_DN1143_c0_g2_i6.p1  ORF type:complete len:706 (+),score=39.50 TRINITY_DN1143_c0_g2_i6:341-2458(+)